MLEVLKDEHKRICEVLENERDKVTPGSAVFTLREAEAYISLAVAVGEHLAGTGIYPMTRLVDAYDHLQNVLKNNL